MGASAASGDGLALYGHALTRPQISRRPDFYAFAQSSSPDAPPHMRKRQRTMDATSVDAHPAMAQRGPPPPPMSVNEDAFITDEHAADDGDDDDDDGDDDGTLLLLSPAVLLHFLSFLFVCSQLYSGIT